MLTNEFIQELYKLSPAEKLRVAQLLINDLAAHQESLLSSDTVYEIWSPQDTGNTAATLLEMLEEDRQAHNLNY